MNYFWFNPVSELVKFFFVLKLLFSFSILFRGSLFLGKLRSSTEDEPNILFKVVRYSREMPSLLHYLGLTAEYPATYLHVTLNKNSIYCAIPRSSKGTDPCK